jgi:hypothetical protein
LAGGRLSLCGARVRVRYSSNGLGRGQPSRLGGSPSALGRTVQRALGLTEHDSPSALGGHGALDQIESLLSECTLRNTRYNPSGRSERGVGGCVPRCHSRHACRCDNLKSGSPCGTVSRPRDFGRNCPVGLPLLLGQCAPRVPVSVWFTERARNGALAAG